MTPEKLRQRREERTRKQEFLKKIDREVKRTRRIKRLQNIRLYGDPNPKIIQTPGIPGPVLAYPWKN